MNKAINEIWLLSRLAEIDDQFYRGQLSRHDHVAKRLAIRETHASHVNKMAVLERRLANSKAYRGIGSFYGVTWTPDRDGGIFQKSSLDLSRLERSPNLLFGHNPAHRLGKIEDVEIDDYGAFVTGRFNKTPEGRHWRTTVRERLGRGKSVYASIGVAKGSRSHVTRQANGLEYKTFTRAPVEEFSIVPYPAQPRAEFLSCT